MSALDAAQRKHLRDMCELIVSDMEADTNRWEGAVWDGRSTAQQFGEVRATISALATMIQILAKDES